MSHRHFILHKPRGYLSQFVNNQNRRKNKKLLGALYDFPEGTMAIGRLDENSEGLLLLTTDGSISEAVRSKKIEKEYFVELDGEITHEAIQTLSTGVTITVNSKPYSTLPCKAAIIHDKPIFEGEDTRQRHRPTSWASITITEGKFRQVRKMTAKVGFPTLRLIRVRIGNTLLRNQTSGACVEVNHFDL